MGAYQPSEQIAVLFRDAGISAAVARIGATAACFDESMLAVAAMHDRHKAFSTLFQHAIGTIPERA
jgi:hypothetical protein